MLILCGVEGILLRKHLLIYILKKHLHHEMKMGYNVRLVPHQTLYAGGSDSHQITDLGSLLIKIATQFL